MFYLGPVSGWDTFCLGPVSGWGWVCPVHVVWRWVACPVQVVWGWGGGVRKINLCLPLVWISSWRRCLVGCTEVPTVGVRLQGSGDPLGDDVGSDVQVLQLRVSSVRIHDQRVLFDYTLKEKRNNYDQHWTTTRKHTICNPVEFWSCNLFEV